MTTSINIVEFDNDRTTPLMKIVFSSNVITFILAFGFLFAAIMNTGSERRGRTANLELAWTFLGVALALLVFAFMGVLLLYYLDRNEAERKRQAASRQASLNLLSTQYGIDIPYTAVDKLRARYINHDREVDPLLLSRFDGVQANGTPGSYALRMNANGVIEMFFTLGVEWVAVPLAA